MCRSIRWEKHYMSNSISPPPLNSLCTALTWLQCTSRREDPGFVSLCAMFMVRIDFVLTITGGNYICVCPHLCTPSTSSSVQVQYITVYCTVRYSTTVISSILTVRFSTTGVSDNDRNCGLYMILYIYSPSICSCASS